MLPSPTHRSMIHVVTGLMRELPGEAAGARQIMAEDEVMLTGADGSVLHLAPGSVAVLPAAGHGQRVRLLRGAVVAHIADRPARETGASRFVLTSELGELRVMGTRFLAEIDERKRGVR